MLDCGASVQYSAASGSTSSTPSPLMSLDNENLHLGSPLLLRLKRVPFVRSRAKPETPIPTKDLDLQVCKQVLLIIIGCPHFVQVEEHLLAITADWVD